ncbi:triose-phosphate isomerase family protein [Arthrobacter sp. M4]|uniref:triose-phosphate isomerase family protein n=1 Tax=Arthrobacter sp. M4 TaxID=218160 RepID=UPI001CDC6ED7|nr:triose-phosphate isomerase family protein [Arthrobacter sp. M4]MCA4133955.1 triose-phosphate isomerase [Arthrobacter sp. M4]
MKQLLPENALANAELFVGVSTKMYLGYQRSLDWLAQLRAEVDSRPAVAAGRVVPFVIPSFPVLPAAAEILDGSPVLLGAQNCGWADGPWTGEVSPSMLAELGVRVVEIGHAERRRHFAEDDAVVARKVRAAIDAGLTPLLCVGEDAAPGASATTNDSSGGHRSGGCGTETQEGLLSEREAGRSSEQSGPAQAANVVYRQIEAAVGGDWGLASHLVIAYEPVWAIGAAQPASPRYVSDVVLRLRALLADRDHGTSLAGLPVIYGGSAGPGLLPSLDGVSGLFLGRFAHDPANFGTVLDEALALAEGHKAA